jgi:hypothetical protein
MEDKIGRRGRGIGEGKERCLCGKGRGFCECLDLGIGMCVGSGGGYRVKGMDGWGVRKKVALGNKGWVWIESKREERRGGGGRIGGGSLSSSSDCDEEGGIRWGRCVWMRNSRLSVGKDGCVRRVLGPGWVSG